MFKIRNESIINDSRKNRIYTDVDVEFEILNISVPITCPIYTTATHTQQIKLLKITGK